MLRTVFRGTIGAAGVGLFAYGLIAWVSSGFVLSGLIFYGNSFGKHPLHLALLGVLMVVYCASEIWVNLKPRARR